MKINNQAELAQYLELEPDIPFGTIEREIYESTDCGAWIDTTATGIKLGSIVEGSEAEVGPYFLDYPFTSEAFEETIADIEREVEQFFESEDLS